MGKFGRRKRQASPRSPIRVAWNSTGGTLLVIITLLGVGGMYLAVNAKVAEAGRKVLILEGQRKELMQRNAELTSQLARLLAPESMMERASELGFRAARPGEIDYLVVEGYQPPDEFVAPQPPLEGEGLSGGVSPSYSETIGDWLSRAFDSRADE